MTKEATNGKLKVVIIHGSFGKPDGNWFPWLKEKVIAQGHEAVVPKFPTPQGQSLDAWREIFQTEIGPLDERTILIGHSLGAAFTLNLLEEHDTPPVAAAFLICGFVGKLDLPEFDKVNATFVSRQFDWTRIRKNARTIRVINSDNDPYVPFVHGAELSSELKAPFTTVPGGGHLNSESGYNEFPLLWEKLAKLLN